MNKMKVVFFLGILLVTLGISLTIFLRNQNIHSISGLMKNITYSTKEDNHSLLSLASNQWYSTIYKNFPSQPIFAMPLAFKLSQEGLSFSYPDVVKTPNTIFGSYNEDFVVGTNTAFSKPEITQIGDWNIKLKMIDDNNQEMSFFIAHGMPYTIINTNAKNLKIHFLDVPQIISSSDKNSLLVKVKNHYYLFKTNNSESLNIQNNILMLPNVKSLFVALLDNPNNKELFLKIAENDLVGTKANYESDSTNLRTTYLIDTKNGSTLTTLYPHQYNNLTSKVKILGTYKTIRGDLRLVDLSSFTTSIPLIIPDTTFQKISNPSSTLVTQLNKDVDSYIAQGEPNSHDYYLGTWFGKGVTLLQLADTLGQGKSKNRLLSYLTPLFIKSLKNFSYNNSTTSFVANYPEFGNDQNNDHHFHYGYYIRTASILSTYNNGIIPQIKPTIDNMVEDIANANKQSTKYPYLRNFDTYESHSWADGFANFGDGNDQESSSEAINAWYAVYLWGKVNNENNLMSTGLYLYNQEIIGTKYYWFDVDNFYNSPYQHAIGSIIWGGKIDFSTWFSGETNMKYGIQLLPFTPASKYLGTLTNFTKYQNDYFQSGGNIENSWGDLFLMWESFYDPKLALSQNKLATQHESNVPPSLFLYEILSNQK